MDSALHGMGRKLWNQEDTAMRNKVQVGMGASQPWDRLRLEPKGGRTVQKAGKRSQEKWRKPTHRQFCRRTATTITQALLSSHHYHFRCLKVKVTQLPSHLITRPARADSGSAEPGVDLALPRAFLFTPRSTPRVCAAQVGRPVLGEAPGARCVGAGCLLPAAPRLGGARTYLCSARTDGLSAGSSCLGDLRACWWRRSLELDRR